MKQFESMKRFEMKVLVARIAAVATTAFALTAFAAAQEPAVTYRWAAPAAVQTQNIAPSAYASTEGHGVSASPNLQNLQSNYRNYRRRDALGTFNDVVYGRQHPLRTVAIIGGGAVGGAVLGGLTYGSKGAIIGAIGGGLAGYAIDRSTHHRTIFGY